MTSTKAERRITGKRTRKDKTDTTSNSNSTVDVFIKTQFHMTGQASSSCVFKHNSEQQQLATLGAAYASKQPAAEVVIVASCNEYLSLPKKERRKTQGSLQTDGSSSGTASMCMMQGAHLHAHSACKWLICTFIQHRDYMK